MEATPLTGKRCCPPFDRATWDERELVWRDKIFVKDHVQSLFHVPLDLERKTLRSRKLIDKVGAAPERALMLSDERSPWGADIYFDVTKRVGGMEMTTLSGTFLTKVFEGPYRHADDWVEEMRRYVASRGHRIEALYFGHTMCPACAEAYGKNYVVLFAKLEEPAAAA